jgi:DNA repair exonuclease SbcCD nuclease subunit
MGSGWGQNKGGLMPKIKVACIGDLHFGIAATPRVRKELDMFLDFIKNNDIDILVFNGDYFDHKLSLNEYAAMIGMEFFKEVIEIAKNKNMVVRMIEGTMSHDRLQPQIFDNFILDENGNRMIDYRFFPTAADEKLKGLDILYLPEEYPLNIDEFYAPFKKNQYDLIFVHGMWDFINFGSTIDNSRNTINTAPVFKYSEWKHSLEHGTAVCGHIHGQHAFYDAGILKIIYPSSFSAWDFNQISKRGFAYFSVDTDTHKMEYKFIENTLAPTFANINVSDLGLDLEKTKIEDIKQKIDEQIGKVDYIKIDLEALPEEKKAVLKGLYKDSKNITVRTTKDTFLQASESDEYKKYEYLLKDNLTVEAAVSRFIKEEFGKDLPEAKIKDIIASDDAKTEKKAKQGEED